MLTVATKSKIVPLVAPSKKYRVVFTLGSVERISADFSRCCRLSGRLVKGLSVTPMCGSSTAYEWIPADRMRLASWRKMSYRRKKPDSVS